MTFEGLTVRQLGVNNKPYRARSRKLLFIEAEDTTIPSGDMGAWSYYKSWSMCFGVGEKNKGLFEGQAYFFG